MLVGNDGMRDVDGHKILGRVVAVEREGRLMTGDLVARVPVAGIDPNAVSTIGSMSLSNEVQNKITKANGVTSASPSTVAIVSASTVTTGGAIEVDVTTTIEISATAGTQETQLALYIQRDGVPVPGAASWQGAYNLSNGTDPTLNAPMQITLVCTDNVPAGTHTYELVSVIATTFSLSQGELALACFSPYIKLREIKK